MYIWHWTGLCKGTKRISVVFEMGEIKKSTWAHTAYGNSNIVEKEMQEASAVFPLIIHYNSNVYTQQLESKP